MESASVEKQDTTQQLDNNKTTQKTDMNEKMKTTRTDHTATAKENANNSNKIDSTSSKTQSSRNNANKTTKNKSSTYGPSRKQLAENLNGANVSNFDTYKPKKPTDLRAPPKPLSDNENENEHDATQVDRSLVTIHASIQTNNTQINPPHEVKRLLIQMRKGDPMIQVVPISDDEGNSSDKIGNEDEIPDDETKLAK